VVIISNVPEGTTAKDILEFVKPVGAVEISDVTKIDETSYSVKFDDAGIPSCAVQWLDNVLLRNSKVSVALPN